MLRNAGRARTGAGVRADSRSVISHQLRQASLQETSSWRLRLQATQEITQEEIVQATQENQENIQTQETRLFRLDTLLTH